MVLLIPQLLLVLLVNAVIVTSVLWFFFSLSIEASSTSTTSTEGTTTKQEGRHKNPEREYEAHCESGLSGPSRCLTIATLLATADYNDDDDDDDNHDYLRVCFD